MINLFHYHTEPTLLDGWGVPYVIAEPEYGGPPLRIHCMNGKPHREDGPAETSVYGEYWYAHGLRVGEYMSDTKQIILRMDVRLRNDVHADVVRIQRNLVKHYNSTKPPLVPGERRGYGHTSYRKLTPAEWKSLGPDEVGAPQ
jgi:hypothetical protein